MSFLNEKFDVIIVGAGPVGLISANLLGCYGVKTLIIEKENQLYTYPRAIGIDDETLRNLQLIGFTQEEIQNLCIVPKIEYFSKTSYRSFEPNVNIKPYGYPILSTFLQPELELMLQEKLKRFQCVTLVKSCEFLDDQQKEEEVTCKISYNSETKFVDCKYLLGCDGGKSNVRKVAGLSLVGDTQDEGWLVVDLEDSETIRKNIAAYKDATEHERPVAIISMPKGLRRFESRLDNETLARGDPNEADVKRILQPFLKNAVPKIIRSRVYYRGYRVVDHFNDRNMFLLGDAAHLVPPYGGQGMCSGIRDAVNLCWKISLILRFGKLKNVIQSYDVERREHILQIINFVKSLSQNVEDKSKNIKSKGITTDYYRNLKPLPQYSKGFVLPSKYAGDLLLQPKVLTADGKEKLLDDFLGINFSIVGVDIASNNILDHESLDFWKSLSCQFVSLNTKNQDHIKALSPDSISLSLKEPVDMFTDPEADIFIVRPDRFILATCKSHQFNNITQQFKSYLRS